MWGSWTILHRELETRRAEAEEVERRRRGEEVNVWQTFIVTKHRIECSYSTAKETRKGYVKEGSRY